MARFRPSTSSAPSLAQIDVKEADAQREYLRSENQGNELQAQIKNLETQAAARREQDLTFIGGATSLSTTVVDVMEVLPIWQRALPILHAVPEVSADKADPGRLTGQVSVDRAIFCYREDGPLTLDNVSIHAEPGEFIALVGPSGAVSQPYFDCCWASTRPNLARSITMGRICPG